MKVMKNFLKKIRSEKGISQYELFSRSGVWPSVISFVERSFWNPRPDIKRRLAKGLRVKVGDIFPDDPGETHRGSSRESCERSATEASER